MSAPECPAVSWYEGLPCGLPAGHTDYHEAKGGGVVWGTPPPAREGRRVMTDHTTLTDADRAALIEVTEKHFMLTDLRRVPLCCNCGNWYAEGDYPWPGFRAHLAMHVRLAVERIVAARVAEARADERERIAQAIEGKYLGPDSGRSHDGHEAPDAALRNAYDEGLEVAACIARDKAECPECGHGTADGRLACGPDCDQGRIAREGADR